jgi:hypothetical protein
VKTITSNTTYFRKYVFWLLTVITMLLITGIITLVSDHYNFKNHIDNSYIINTKQSEQIDEVIRQVDITQKKLINDDKDIEYLKNSRSEDINRFERIEHKVFRGGGNDSFDIKSYGKIYDEYNFNK